MKVEHRLVIVAGGSGGLGRDTVRAIVAAKGHVGILDLNSTVAADLVNELSNKFVYFPGPVDVTSEDQVSDALAKIRAHFKGVVCIGAVLCNGILMAPKSTPGYGPDGVLTSFAQFKHVMDVNLMGTYNVIHKLSEYLIKNPLLNDDGERGVIVTVSSITGLDGTFVAYGTSKAAVAGLTLPLARELAPFGIRIISLAPGPFETAMIHSDSIAAPPCLFPKRFGRPEEFADVVLQVFKQPMFNGSVLRLDGGLRT
ncbi:3-hydroxyacyl-CoA dehydrogenase [Gongronella butleri]|nr:3-hydroxyacyl-CoA dehydrogenase [Gongronella butleri]